MKCARLCPAILLDEIVYNTTHSASERDFAMDDLIFILKAETLRYPLGSVRLRGARKRTGERIRPRPSNTAAG